MIEVHPLQGTFIRLSVPITTLQGFKFGENVFKAILRVISTHVKKNDKYIRVKWT
jgi:hypothetical protein